MIPWTQRINFASALLLHSCLTVLLKEFINLAVVSRRLLLRWWLQRNPKTRDDPRSRIRTSVVLDAYTSILSSDRDGELAELYYTNTGFLLLTVSLAASVAMNLSLSSLILNTTVASTFGLAFVASLFNQKLHITLPILSLRRAGRFIWADTPFVNFFTSIYIATVRHGLSSLRLQDYVTFRCIAVAELVFMKAKYAASDSDTQVELMKRLIATEWVAVTATATSHDLYRTTSVAERSNLVAFTTYQRLTVMLIKTNVGYHYGCLQGPSGPAACPIPTVDCYVDDVAKGLRIYRSAEDVIMIADFLDKSSPKGRWMRFLSRAYGVLLRRLGKIRVIYLIRAPAGNLPSSETVWHSNINLVTGVSSRWLEGHFSVCDGQETGVVAGAADSYSPRS